MFNIFFLFYRNKTFGKIGNPNNQIRNRYYIKAIMRSKRNAYISNRYITVMMITLAPCVHIAHRTRESIRYEFALSVALAFVDFAQFFKY